MYSVSFGVLSVAAGLSVAQTCVLSLVTFTGASQFTFVSVIGAGGGIVGALSPSILLAGRNAVYALSLQGCSPAVGRAGRCGLTWSSTRRPRWLTRRRLRSPSGAAFDLTALCLFTAWNLGTLAGAARPARAWATRASSAWMPCSRPCSWRCWPRSCVGRARRRAAVTGAVIALVLLTVTPPGVPIIAAALGAVPVLIAARRRERTARA